ncbi:MAG: aminotransferase class V-fold PLP-dependent enzyme, partial [Negativicutes bacterium]|nr:aminotransferase class V-fold PLP-dependent enzyme [Negativicutes bacterium]
MSYIPSSLKERQEMLQTVGVKTTDDLFAVVPSALKIKQLQLSGGKSELEVSQIMQEIAGKNRVFSAIFRGAGAYHHYIPAIVKSVTAKESFLTAYTPYQAEISQGILQSIFEYQTMICELTGMDVSNASIYDGASAAAEAMTMCRERKRDRVLLAATVMPMVLQTIQTYCNGNGMTVELIPAKNGVTDPAALEALLNEQTACVYLQQPNYFGLLEPAEAIAAAAHQIGAKFV